MSNDPVSSTIIVTIILYHFCHYYCVSFGPLGGVFQDKVRNTSNSKEKEKKASDLWVKPVTDKVEKTGTKRKKISGFVTGVMCMDGEQEMMST